MEYEIQNTLNHLVLDQLIDQLADLLGGVGALNDLARGARGRRNAVGNRGDRLDARADVGGAPGRDLDLGDLLDPQQRWVARLVDVLDNRDQRRQRGLDRLNLLLQVAL